MGVALAASATVPVAQHNFFKEGDRLPAVRATQPFRFTVMAKDKMAPAKADAAKGELSVSLEFDAETYRASYIQVCNPDYAKSEFLMPGDTEVNFELPEGTYTLIVPFDNMNNPDMPGDIYVIKENIGVYEGEMTMLSVKPEMATEKLHFSSVLPDGQLPVLPKVPESYWETMEGEKDYTGANIEELARYCAVGSTSLGVLFNASGNMLEYSDGVHNMDYFDIAVSPVSDEWHFSMTRYMRTLDGNYYFTHSAVNGTKTQPAVNAPVFSEWKSEFATNPVFSEFKTRECWGLNAQNLVNGRINIMAMVLYSYGPKPRLFFSEPMLADTPDWYTYYGVSLDKVEYDIDKEFDWGSMPDIRCIKSPFVVWDKETQSTVFAIGGSGLNGSPLWWAEDGHDPCVYPGNVNFGSATSTQSLPLGGTAPLCETVVMAEGDADSGYEFGLTAVYTGLYGEGRCADDAMTTVFINADGDETVCDLDDLEKTMRDLNESCAFENGFEIELANDRNIVLEGVKGFNNTVVKVAKGTAADVMSPTPTMLQFRNAEGVVINKFDKAADGTIEISGGDFRRITTEDYDEWFECDKADLKVEYAPASSEEFKEIAMEEVPENFFMPNFGYFWRGSLAEVKDLTDGGWYQLRITMKDAAGNSQTQTIYPAFNIAANAGVEGVADDLDVNAPVEYYNLQGVRVNRPAEGSVVIRRQGSSATKIVF